MNNYRAAKASLVIDYIAFSTVPRGTHAPSPPCLGPLTKMILRRLVKAVVNAKIFTLTIRALVSLAWSMWSMWSMQFQLIAHVRARARVNQLFSLTIIFKLYKNTLTTLTKPTMARVCALTTALTKLDHIDHGGLKMDLNKYDLPKDGKQPLSDWKDSVEVMLLSDAIKIAGKKHGISIHRDNDGRPTLHFNPGLKKKDVGSDRWIVANNICELFLAAAPDLLSLIAARKISIPTPEPENERVLPGFFNPIRDAEPQNITTFINNLDVQECKEDTK